jgi:hypothetical protein
VERLLPVVRLLQLLPRPQDASRYACDGSGHCGSYLGPERIIGVVVAIWRKINPNGGIDTGPESGPDPEAPRGWQEGRSNQKAPCGCYKSSRNTQEKQNRLGHRANSLATGQRVHLSLGVVYHNPGKVHREHGLWLSICLLSSQLLWIGINDCTDVHLYNRRFSCGR